MSRDDIKVVKMKTPVNDDAVELLQEFLEKAKSGEVVSVGLVARTRKGEYMTAASSTQSMVEDAAMFMELGMRKLGFTQGDRDDM